MIAHKTAIDPTVAIHEALTQNRNGKVPPGAVDYLDHMPIGVQRSSKQAMIDASAPADDKAYRGAFEQIVATVKMLNDRGVFIVPGTDLGGSFTYARVGTRLFGEYKVWENQKEMPAPEDMAKYIFYTETSHEFQPKEWNKKTGRIGEHKGTAYYLLYAPGDKDGCGLDTDWLATVGKAEKCKRLVVYCEKIWLHREDREKWEDKTGKTLRAMHLPMALK